MGALLDAWFGEREEPEPILESGFPAVCAWVTVGDDYVTIARRRDNQIRLTGWQAEEAKQALKDGTWKPKLHRSRQGCPIYHK